MFNNIITINFILYSAFKKYLKALHKNRNTIKHTFKHTNNSLLTEKFNKIQNKNMKYRINKTILNNYVKTTPNTYVLE